MFTVAKKSFDVSLIYNWQLVVTLLIINGNCSIQFGREIQILSKFIFQSFNLAVLCDKGPMDKGRHENFAINSILLFDKMT